MQKLLFIALLFISVGAYAQSDPAPSAPLPKPATAYQQGDSTYIYQNGKWFHLINMSYFNSHAGTPVNIYNSNGTITGPRRVSMGIQSLSFDNNSTLGSLALQLDATPSNESVNISAGTNNYSKAVFNTGYMNILNRDSATNTTEKIVLSPQNMEFDDDNNHGAHYGDSTAMPLDGSYIPDVYYLNQHFSPISGGAYMPLSGGNFTGRVSQTFNDNFSTNANGFYINTNAFAQADNVSYTGLTVNTTINANGHTGIAGYGFRVLGQPSYFQNNATINGYLITNFIKIQGDTTLAAHHLDILDSANNRIERIWDTGQHEFGTSSTKSTYLVHVSGSQQITGSLNMPTPGTTTPVYGAYFDTNHNLVQGNLPATGGVASFNTRTGAVISQPSDYANKQSALTLIYQNNHFTSGNLTSDFTATGFTPTINTALNSISFSGGGGSSTEYLLINNLTNNDQLVDFAVDGVATSVTGGGIRIGKQSINPMTTEHITGKFDLSTNTWSVGTQLNNNDLFGAVTPYVVAAGDQFRLIMHHRENQFTYTFTDITQGFTTETPVVFQNLNAGNWVITYDGGSVDITGVKIISYTPSYSHIAVFGDSKTLYNIPGNYPNEIGLGNVNVFAGRADATPQLLACIPYWVKYFKCDYAVLNIGRNDIAYGYSLASTMANYNSIVSSLSGTGATVVHLLPIPEKPASGVNQAALVGAIKAAYPGQYVDVRAYGYDSTTMTQPDNVHPLPQGSKVIGYAINASTLIPAQATLYNEYEQQVRNVVNTPNTITPNTFSAPQTFTPATNTVTRRILTHPTSLIDLQIDDNPSSVSSALTISTGQYSSLIEKSASLINTELSATSTATHLVNAYVSSRGTLASPTSLNAVDVIKQFTFYGFDGTTAQPTAFFRSVVDGTPSTGNMPQRFEWGVGANATAAIKLSLLSTGQLNKASTDIANGTTFRDFGYTTALTPIANNSTMTGLYIAPTFNTGTGALTASIGTATTSLADGTYDNLASTATSGAGSGQTWKVTVLSGSVTAIVPGTTATGGIGYAISDGFTVATVTGATFTVASLGYSGQTNIAASITGNLQYNPTGAATGNLYYRASGGIVTGLPIGAANTILSSNGSIPGWAVTLPTAAIPAFTGDITNSAGSTTTTIGANKVTYAKIQAMTTQRVIGSGTGTAAGENSILGDAGTGAVVTWGASSITHKNDTTVLATRLFNSNYAKTNQSASFSNITDTGLSGSIGNPVGISTGGLLTALPITGSLGNVVLSTSPVLTGVPSAPTAAGGTNTTQIATTANVMASIAISASTATDNVIAKTANYTILSTDFAAGHNTTLNVYCDASGGAMTITLPAASSYTGYTINVFKKDSSVNGVTITAILGSGSLVTQYQSKTYKSDGSNWYSN